MYIVKVAFGMDSEYVRKLCGSQDDLLSLMLLSLEGVNLQFSNPLLPVSDDYNYYSLYYIVHCYMYNEVTKESFCHSHFSFMRLYT